MKDSTQRNTSQDKTKRKYEWDCQYNCYGVKMMKNDLKTKIINERKCVTLWLIRPIHKSQKSANIFLSKRKFGPRLIVKYNSIKIIKVGKIC